MRTQLLQLAEIDKRRTLFAHIGAALGWDQETYLPENGVEERAEQLALIEGLAHESAVDPKIGALLAEAEAIKDLDEREKAYLRVARREYDKETKLPQSLVVETAKETSISQAVWAKARKENDFAAFAPHLEKMLKLRREAAACLDPQRPAYDVLLDLFEYGSTEKSVASVFSTMKSGLVEVLGRITQRPQVEDGFLYRKVGADAQARMSEYLMDALGYDRSRGRLDTTAHPFTTTLGRDDVRITTRYIEDYFASSIFSTIHEAGHAMYELDIDPGSDYRWTRLDEAASMAIHESQSRMWENMIGRSPLFWARHFGKIRELADGALEGVELDSFVRAINRVAPSLIRTEADEVTYGLHIIARFELESELIGGRLSVADLPAAWNEKIRALLGVQVPNDAEGCLQDIHWSMGAFGYFPSYALGNLYAAQFWGSMAKDMPTLQGDIEAGDYAGVKGWLSEKIHKDGARYLPGEIVERATGSALDPAHFIGYLENKYSAIYGF